MADSTCREQPLNGSDVQMSCNHDQDREKEDADRLECAVCLQPCIHPVQLPCGHIFCYLCVKGVAMVNQSKRCAMCRKELPSGYLEHPNLLNAADLLEETSSSAAFDDGRQWFYEGHNGWWQYDERTSVELEAAFARGDRVCELLIAGFLYVIDFDGMVQFRRNDPSRRRRIKRDMATIAKKGIAGLRLPGATQDEESDVETTTDATTDDPVSERPRQRHGQRQPVLRQRSDRDSDGAEGVEENSFAVVPGASTASLNVLGAPSWMSHSSSSRRGVGPAPTVPSNTPQTPHTPSQDSGTSSPTTVGDPTLHDIVQGMQNLLGAISSEGSDSDEEVDDLDDSADVGLLVANKDVADEIL